MENRNLPAWQRIKDLPSDWKQWESGELSSLAGIWQKQRDTHLKNSMVLKEFNTRLGRSWAIETGIIEGLYTLDRGITQVLVERGIVESLVPHDATNRPVSRVISILKDHETALEGVFDFVKNERQLSTSYIKEVHAALTQNQLTTDAMDSLGRHVEVELLRGAWKIHPNSPTRPDGLLHAYCPPEHTSAEMDQLVSLHECHNSEGVAPEIEAAWLHHRFTQIHPFQDGNGRVARVLASVVFLRAGWFPLVIDRDLRSDYIDALEYADAGDLGPLIALFAGVQKKAFLKALGLLENIVDRSHASDQLFASIQDRLSARHEAKFKSWERVFDRAKTLESAAEYKLQQIRMRLEPDLKAVDDRYWVAVSTSNPQTEHYFRTEIISTARELDYFADTNTYRSWVRLKIKEERQADLVLSFHSFGYDFIGLMSATAFIEFREWDEDQQRIIQGPLNLSNEVFQFAFSENEESLKKRFDIWCEKVIFTGLDQWRRQL